MLVPIQINEDYTYYLNLTKVNGLALIDRTDENGYAEGWYLYFSGSTGYHSIVKIYNTKEEAEKEIDRINRISGKILKIWEEN